MGPFLKFADASRRAHQSDWSSCTVFPLRPRR